MNTEEEGRNTNIFIAEENSKKGSKPSKKTKSTYRQAANKEEYMRICNKNKSLGH